MGGLEGGKWDVEAVDGALVVSPVEYYFPWITFLNQLQIYIVQRILSGRLLACQLQYRHS